MKRFLPVFATLLFFSPLAAEAQTSCATGDIDCFIREETVRIQQRPESGWSLIKRANLYKDKKSFDLAIADYNRALVVKDPTISDGHFEDMVYNYRGDAYFQKRDYDNAIKDLTTPINRGSNWEDLFFKRGNAYFEKLNFDGALKDFDRVEKIFADKGRRPRCPRTSFSNVDEPNWVRKT